MKYSLKELIIQIEKPDLSQYKKYTPLFIEEAGKGLNWTEWDEDVFNDFFEKAHNSVAYLGQGVLRPHHKEVIKKNWLKLVPHLKLLLLARIFLYGMNIKQLERLLKNVQRIICRLQLTEC